VLHPNRGDDAAENANLLESYRELHNVLRAENLPRERVVEANADFCRSLGLAERIGYAVEPHALDRATLTAAALARAASRLSGRSASVTAPYYLERAEGITRSHIHANVILRDGAVALEPKHDADVGVGAKVAPVLRLESPDAALFASLGGARYVALLGHYDVHGMIMMAVTQSNLEAHGSVVTPFFGYKATGDVHRLWKRLLPKLARDGGFDAIVLVDVPIDARDPERTRANVQAASEAGVRIVIVDHHGDTFIAARGLAGAGACVHLTDAWGCFLGPADADWKMSAATLAALSDRQVDATPTEWTSPESVPYRTVESLSAHLDGIRTDMNLSAQDDPLALMYLPLKEGQGALPPADAERPTALNVERVGRAVVFREPPQAPGRQWYRVLERAMEAHPTTGADGITPAGAVAAPYAIAWRRMDKLGNILFLTYWLEPFAPPIRLFTRIEEGWRVFGHDAAFWLEVPLDRVEGVVSETAAAISAFFRS